MAFSGPARISILPQGRFRLEWIPILSRNSPGGSHYQEGLRPGIPALDKVSGKFSTIERTARREGF